MSSPELTLDSDGLLTWTNPSTPPYRWVIEQCLSNGSSLSIYNMSCGIEGSIEYLDCSVEWFAQGLHLIMYGVDIDDNLVLLPSITSNPLIY